MTFSEVSGIKNNDMGDGVSAERIPLSGVETEPGKASNEDRSARTGMRTLKRPMNLAQEARNGGEALLHILDAEAPGVVTGLHLTGSAALGDFQPGRSDLDFVAVLARPLSNPDIATLDRVHDHYLSDGGRPRLDGVWVSVEDLVAGPDAAALGAATRAGGFYPIARGARDPVTWATLATHGVSLRGDLPADLWRDPRRLSAWVASNVETYWAKRLARARNPFNPLAFMMLRDAEVQWAVLGLSRMAHTLATGEIVSKSAAGRAALARFPGRQTILRECLRLREGEAGPSLYNSRLGRRRAALAYMADAIETCRRLSSRAT